MYESDTFQSFRNISLTSKLMFLSLYKNYRNEL